MQWGCTVHYTKAVQIPLDIGIDLEDVEIYEDEEGEEDYEGIYPPNY